jgi:hypothetical protein
MSNWVAHVTVTLTQPLRAAIEPQCPKWRR